MSNSSTSSTPTTTTDIEPVSNLAGSSNTLVNFYLPGASSPSVVAALLGDSTYGPVQGSGGWQVVDRPKTVAATQWYDRSPFQLQMTLLIDDSFSSITGSTGTVANTENMCQVLESWLDVEPNSTNYQPTTFTLTGPVPGVSAGTGKLREWFIFTMSFTNAIRGIADGNRVQQQLDITLYEYNTPIPGGNSTTSAASSPSGAVQNLIKTSGNLSVTPFISTYSSSTSAAGTLTSPVAASALKSTSSTTPTTVSTVSSSGAKLYTIKKGDTLQLIAARQKQNNSSYISRIKTLNGIRDDSAIANMVGYVIKLPAS